MEKFDRHWLTCATLKLIGRISCSNILILKKFRTFAHHYQTLQSSPMSMKQKIVLSFSLISLISGFIFSTHNNELLTYNSNDSYQVYRIRELGPNFCGEELPFDIQEVNNKYQKQLDIYTYHRTSTEVLLKRANRWFPTIEKILAENGLPEDFKYLALVESNLTNVISYRGAGGFWQFIPGTGRYFGLRIDAEIDERFNPIASTEAACRYFKKSNDGLKSSWTNVAASYNMGVYGMKKRIRNQGTDDYYRLKLNKETTGYLYKIAVLKEIYENQDEYGFDCHKMVKPYVNAVEETVTTSSINDLESYAYNKGLTTKQLRKLNPWLIGKSITIKKDKAIRIVLPETQNKVPRSSYAINASRFKVNLQEELAYGY